MCLNTISEQVRVTNGFNHQLKSVSEPPTSNMKYSVVTESRPASNPIRFFFLCLVHTWWLEQDICIFWTGKYSQFNLMVKVWGWNRGTRIFQNIRISYSSRRVCTWYQKKNRIGMEAGLQLVTTKIIFLIKLNKVRYYVVIQYKFIYWQSCQFI